MRAYASEILSETSRRGYPTPPDSCINFMTRAYAHGGWHAAGSVGENQGHARPSSCFWTCPFTSSSSCHCMRWFVRTIQFSFQMINGVLLLVFARLDAQTLCTWLAACFHLPSKNRSKFAWTAQVYDFGRFGGYGQSKYHWLAATGISGLSTHGPMDQISKSKTKTKPQSKYRTPANVIDRNKLHNASQSCSRQTTTSTKNMVSEKLTMPGWEENPPQYASIYLSWFPWEYEWIRWPCFWFVHMTHTVSAWGGKLGNVR